MPDLRALADLAGKASSGHDAVLHLLEAGNDPVNKKPTLLDSLDAFGVTLKRGAWAPC